MIHTMKNEREKDEQMKGNGTGDEGVKAICEMLKVNTSLTALDMGSEEPRKRRKQEKNRS